MISATDQNVTDVVEDGVGELVEGQGALGRKVDARAGRIEGAVEDGVAELAEGQDALGRKIDALRITEIHAKEGRAGARQDKDRAIGRELRLDWIADTPFGAGGFGSVFMPK